MKPDDDPIIHEVMSYQIGYNVWVFPPGEKTS